MDLEKFEQFKRKFDPTFANKSGSGKSNSIKWPTGPGSQSVQKADDDDLYSWLNELVIKILNLSYNLE